MEGISAVDPWVFRHSTGMTPVQMLPLGRTRVHQEAFDAWCFGQMRSGHFSGRNYDLFQRNCNHFSHHAATQGLGLSQGVPQWILDVPQRFLSSPMGQAVRPMLEGMQMPAQQEGMISLTTTETGATASSAPSAATPNPTANPWEGMSAPSTLPSATPAPSTQPKSLEVPTPTLDSYNRPMLSRDAKTAGVCAKKLGNAPVLQEVATILAAEGKRSPSRDQLKSVQTVLMDSFHSGQNVVFGLMLLRLLVLEDPVVLSESIEWVREQLEKDEMVHSSSATRSMAWCTVSNAFATAVDKKDDVVVAKLQPLTDAAVTEVTSSEKPEVRQAASTFLYNLALYNEDNDDSDGGVPDRVVALLCGALEGVDQERDATTQLRRLLVVGHLVKPSCSKQPPKDARRALVKDLGLNQVLQDVVSASETRRDVKEVATEIQKLLS